ncbi:TPA: penicillin-binding protein 2 [Candidatus Poribacteria bacterium]|nr:penicillin-binding protein 2 [Candidatus Poribacteria bacterium]
MVSRVQRVRAVIFFIVVQLFFLIMIARVIHIEMKAKTLKKRSEELITGELGTRVRRGKITDRSGRSLAVNIDTLSVWADPTLVKNPDATARKLAPVLKSDPEKIKEKLNRKERKFVWLAKKLDLSLMKPIIEMVRSGEIRGIWFEVQERRIYPKRNLLSHVIGFVNYRGGGISGVEKYYNDQIKYYETTLHIYRDARNRIFHYPDGEPNLPRYNSELVLTIDEMIQHIAEEELSKACKFWKASGGTIIVMNPKTGEILAMANYPSFDLNEYGTTAESVKLNRAIQMAFEPGSVFKIVPISGALEEGLLSPSSSIFCEKGVFYFRGHPIHDIAPYGWLTLRQVLAKSSNIGALKVARTLGKERFEKYIKLFGFGRKTGIDLPFEKRGDISALKIWSDEAILTYIPFGQGITATPLQILCAFNAIANGGVMMKPHIGMEIRDSRGNPIERFKPQVERRVISARTAGMMTRMLNLAIREGTGTKAKIEGVEVAGKTGTAQKAGKNGYSKERFVSSFVGFFPLDNPSYSIIVIIDEPKGKHHGGDVAAPVFSAVGRKILQYEKVRGVYAKAFAGEGNEIEGVVSGP